MIMLADDVVVDDVVLQHTHDVDIVRAAIPASYAWTYLLLAVSTDTLNKFISLCLLAETHYW